MGAIMPWKVKQPTPDQIQRRIAYLIALRCREQGATNIAARSGIGRKTVSKYGDPDYCASKGGGPQKFEVLLRILQATGDDLANVMYAAIHSHDETTFRAMLHCVLIAQQNVAISSLNEERLNSAHVTGKPVPMAKRKLAELPVGDTTH